ncbi:right-handed parallel beta-helix repeat-containing protein [Microbacterium sp. PM5]|uniref:right-handed parallel beta-helix repeat-containing protein n=1 Tax=Microbacterium sp. PM5 TaxID=2014534 RepID=UPI000DD1356B|nr:right-handed parallel beta-helix repeat-containing protein [Microbacterium sp. PM5]AXA95474.1 hypothetical protein CEP17_03025 [Microbacterium sp. PM5]
MTVAQITARKDTSANWAAANPILAAGEFGFDTTVKRLKVGDGVSSWAALGWSTMAADEVASVLAASASINAGIDTTDGAFATVLADPESASSGVLGATFVPQDAKVYQAQKHGVLPGSSLFRGALNGLIAMVSAAGGGEIDLGSGDFQMDMSSLIAKSGVHLHGRGALTTIHLTRNITGTPGLVQIGAGVDGFTLSKVKLVGHRDLYQADQNCGVWGVPGGGYSNILIEDVWVDGFDYMGIGLIGDVNRLNVTKNVTVRNCRTTNTGGHGILIQGGVDVASVRGCLVEKHGQRRADCPGITNGRHSYGVSMVGNTIDSTGAVGTSAHAMSLDTVFGRAIVSNNIVHDSPGYGIEIGSTEDAIVIGNVVTDCRHGIVVNGDGGQSHYHCHSITITGNTVSRCTVNGIYVYMGNPISEQATPPWQYRRAGFGYGTTTIGTRATAGGRIYKLTATVSPFTTASGVPTGWGETSTGDTITDGNVTWTDVGHLHSDIVIASNMVTMCGGVGIHATYAVALRIEGNSVTSCAQSGLYVEGTCNLYWIGPNTLHGNNTNLESNHANLRIIAPAASSRAVRLAATLWALFASLSNDDIFISEPASGVRIDGRLLPNSPNPSVAFGDRFVTANTTATSVATMVDANANASEMREVKVVVRDANTTFVHSASGTNTLRMAGGSSYAAPLGTVLVFAFISSQWYEVARYAGAA